ncbi:MAG: response regulator transcription factor [Spirochaetaceae bacterium]|nr:MAG: response regulator transcription factor [Spirochaetaceae bacterium]
MSGIKVLIVDTQETVRQGLRTVLQLTEDLEVVGDAASGSEAIRLTEELRPQVMVIDMMISIEDGLRAIKEIKRRYPDIGVVLLTSCAGITTGGRLQEYKIDAIVEKESAVQILVQTIRQFVGQKKEKSK